jgi:hypothetical protein
MSSNPGISLQDKFTVFARVFFQEYDKDQHTIMLGHLHLRMQQLLNSYGLWHGPATGSCGHTNELTGSI